ncbi:MAG: esterase [Ilumatobacteraceae bacterium]|nr:esterase [Ilumatobacteraceae bacterium]
MTIDGPNIDGPNIDGAVFVHGGHHDRSCWQLVLPLMDVPSIAVDLPGRGDRPATGEPITYAMCAQAVLADADAAGFDRFVLVGHSMGGLTISRSAFDVPERVAHLVYVGALAPPAGVSVAEALGVEVGVGQPDSAMLPAIDADVARAIFAGDMSDEQWAVARTSLVDEAVNLFRDTLPGFASGIPTTYIGMTDDVPVPPALAARMIEQLGPDVDFRQIEAAHNVMLSQPATLAAIINALVREAAPD